jgi:hypothetical protein
MKKLLRFLLVTSLLFCVTGLYAQTYKALLCLNYGEYDQKFDTITVRNGQPIQLTNWTVPKRTGYTFKGYYNSKDAESQYWHPTQYVDKNGKGVHNVNTNRDYEQTFYAHWTPKKFVLTFYTSVGELEEEIGIRPESPSHDIVTQGANLKINIDVEYDSKIADRLWSQDIITIRPGYKFLSLYDAEGSGEEIYRVVNGGNAIDAVKGIYWDGNGTEGRWIKDLGEDGDTLIIYPQYDPKFEIVENGDRINFFNNDIQVRDIMGAIDEDNRDWHASPLVLDVTQYTSGIQSGKGMVDNKGKVFYDGTQALEWLLDYYKDNGKIEPNCLTYLSPNSNYTTHDNVVRMKEKKCTNFVLTDRYRVKIPYAFTAQNAIYERDKGYDESDGAVNQAKDSHMGTICLPFPVKNKQQNGIDGIKLYKKYKINGLTIEVTNTLGEGETLEANTPCIYKRLYQDTSKGSKIIVKASNAVVPVNTTYKTNEVKLDNWGYFIGCYKPLMFVGSENSRAKNITTEILVPKNRDYEILYYKQDKFTLLTDKGSLYMHPYRAYFKYNGRLNSKDFSIVFEDEDETGINEVESYKTNKIYTLNGIRVNTMQKGQMYIVNGKKFVY